MDRALKKTILFILIIFLLGSFASIDEFGFISIIYAIGLLILIVITIRSILNHKDNETRELKKVIDKNGYKRGQHKHSDLIHRQIAYSEIYLKNRNEYPLKFHKYVIHHIDGNKLNNDVSNLQILTKEEHEAIHRRFR